MNCKMREVEIILIEDSNKPDSTQALVLSFNVDVEAKHVSMNNYVYISFIFMIYSD